METWQEQLSKGNSQGSWDIFIHTYRPLILATIRHSINEYDEVMDVFAEVCAALSANDMARLKAFEDTAPHTAKFSTWLVVVVRNKAIDLVRATHGRDRKAIPKELSERERHIFELVFIKGVKHVEAYSAIAAKWPNVSFSEFLRSLHALYRRHTPRVASSKSATSADASVPIDGAALADEQLEGKETSAKVRDLLHTLSDEDQLAVQLFVMEGTPAAEVARILGWPNAKMVYNRVYRSLAGLRVSLEREGVIGSD